jgi:anaerobic ribonucleoside-triphosphate reductase activating protein
MRPEQRQIETLRVAALVEVTQVEGPGSRFALWVQGCSIRCPGCCNPHFFHAGGGEVIGVEELLARLRAVSDRVEGVTLLGGEPFEQAEALARFARGAGALGLSVMTFSGFTLEELRARPDARELLAATDLLVDGRYEAALPERERRWAGSRNQRFHFLTDRYAPGIELPPSGDALRAVEVTLGSDGSVRVNGWPALVGLARRR